MAYPQPVVQSSRYTLLFTCLFSLINHPVIAQHSDKLYSARIEIENAAITYTFDTLQGEPRRKEVLRRTRNYKIGKICE